MEEKYDVAIIGAGPSGCSAAHLLAGYGLKVIVLEKNSEVGTKACGEGLSPRGVRALKKLNLLEETEKYAKKISGVSLIRNWESRITKSFSNYGLNPDYALTIKRKYLDKLLVEKAESSGAKILTGCRVRNISGIKDEMFKKLIYTSSGKKRSVIARFVVLSTGGNFLNFNRNKNSSERDNKGPKYVGVAIRAYSELTEEISDDCLYLIADYRLFPSLGWVFPLKNRKANFGIGVFLKDLKNMDMGLSELLRLFYRRCINEKILKKPTGSGFKAKSGKIFAGGRRKELFTNGVVIAGEEAGLVNSLSGEGISFAVESGIAAGNSIKKVFEGVSEKKAAKFYEREIKRISSIFKVGNVAVKIAHSQRLLDIFMRNIFKDSLFGKYSFLYWASENPFHLNG